MDAELMRLPPEYGSADVALDWADVRARLEAAEHYWLSTVRPDGRPHAVPLDGVWLDEAWWFGGSSETVKARNLAGNPEAVMTLEDAMSVVIVEGACEHVFPDGALTDRLVAASKAKYGYAPPADYYSRFGVWLLRPRRVLAWTRFPRDATRFVF